MKLITIFTLALSAQASIAATRGYDLTIDYSLNGQRVTSPRVIVKEGETATIIRKVGDEETFIEVEATEGQMMDKSGIKMKLAVGTISKDGERRIISQPELLTTEKAPAELTIKGEETISLSVHAKRKSL